TPDGSVCSGHATVDTAAVSTADNATAIGRRRGTAPSRLVISPPPWTGADANHSSFESFASSTARSPARNDPAAGSPAPATSSSAARRARHLLLGLRRQAVLLAVRLLVIGLLEHLEKPLERAEIVLLGRSNRLFDPVITRDKARIHGVHGRTALRRIRADRGETGAPARGPRIETRRLGEKLAGRACRGAGSWLGR